MRRLITITMLITGLLISASTATAYTEADEREIEEFIKLRCAARWPNDYVMQISCAQRQTEAVNDLGQWDEEVPEEIWATCSKRWFDREFSYDFVMMRSCVKRQIEAYNDL